LTNVNFINEENKRNSSRSNSIKNLKPKIGNKFYSKGFSDKKEIRDVEDNEDSNNYGLSFTSNFNFILQN